MLFKTGCIAKKTGIVIGMLLMFTQVNAQNHKVKFQNMTFKEAMSKAQKTNKIILVDVGSPNMKCKPCKEVENEVFTVDSIASIVNENCIPIKMDMTSDAGKMFAKRLVMLMYPVYVFYDAKGHQLNFVNAASILKDPLALTGRVRAAVETAKKKRENTRSIAFHDQSWDELLAMAKKENKLIFLDAYTSWCRPCMMMASDVFTLDKVADFYNKNFINVSMDMEKGEGPALVKKYGIGAYPAFLFVDGNGDIVFKGGGYQKANKFIQLGQKALQAKENK